MKVYRISIVTTAEVYAETLSEGREATQYFRAAAREFRENVENEQGIAYFVEESLDTEHGSGIPCLCQ